MTGAVLGIQKHTVNSSSWGTQPLLGYWSISALCLRGSILAGVQSQDSGDTLLCHFRAVGPWASYMTSELWVL